MKAHVRSFSTALIAVLCAVWLSAAGFAPAAFALAPGDLDPGFNAGSGANGAVYAVAVQSDGRILVGGAFTSFNGKARNYIARLHGNGSLDDTFEARIGASKDVNAIVVQPDGKILLAGAFVSVNHVPAYRVARLNPDGTVDSTFHTGTGANNAVYSLSLGRDGKIFVVGSFSVFDAVPTPGGLARLNADGSLDTGFQSGLAPGDSGGQAVVQPDGKIILLGSFAVPDDPDNYDTIERLNADGSVDSTFAKGFAYYADDTTFYGDGASTVALLPDGKIAVGGYSSSDFSPDDGGPIGVLLQPDGGYIEGLDVGDYLGEGVTYVSPVIVQPDGKFLFGLGGFVQRDDANGQQDSTFVTSVSFFYTYCLALQTDTNILVGARFFSANGTSFDSVARLLGDGIPGGVHFGATGYRVREDHGTATITVNRGGYGTAAVAVDYATADQTAHANTDYTPVSGTLRWGLTDTRPKTFQVPITDRGLTGGSKTLTLNLSNATNGAVIGLPAPVTLTIVEDDAPTPAPN